MSASYKVIDERDYADSFDERHAFALDVLVGLSETRKRLPSKYLYDSRGSELFRRISRQPAYYLTDCELGILNARAKEIGEYAGGARFNLVELGAGFGHKTETLIEQFISMGLDFQYVPIDISESAMKGLVDSLSKKFPQLTVEGLITDYFNGLKWLNNRYDCLNFVLFLGSSIGNFTAAEARFFLRNMWNCLDHNDLVLIGMDLKKDIELLLNAYNDAAGVTAEFNLNILHRINRELGGKFDLSTFRHYGTYDVFSGGMESYIVSLKSQSVTIEMIGRSFSFEPWEPIHTEYSYKYLVSDIERLASNTGFVVLKHIFDVQKYFTDSIWRVEKPTISKSG